MSIEIKVSDKGGTYFAQTGKGRDAKKASSTNSAYWAAHAVAEKVFGPGSDPAVVPTEGTEQHGTRFRAHDLMPRQPASRL